MAEKTVNYTPEMTAEMVTAYKAADTQDARETVVQEMADKFGKTVRSVVAKLSREGVYIKKVYHTKNGSRPAKKDDMVVTLAVVANVDADKLEGLEKAPKRALATLIEAFTSESE